MRQYRQLKNDTKQRISQSLRGRSISDTHKEAISNGMKAYWATVPNRPTENNNVSNNITHEKNM